MRVNKNKLIPEKGKWLTNGQGIYCRLVWLGNYDSSDNWYEINESEVPKDFLNLI